MRAKYLLLLLVTQLINSATLESQQALLKDSYSALEVGSHNINALLDYASEANATLVLLIYAGKFKYQSNNLKGWCFYSQQFLHEFNMLSRRLSREGQAKFIFARADGHQDQDIASHFEVTGFPTTLVMSFSGEQAAETYIHQGKRTAQALMQQLMRISSPSLFFIESKEALDKLRIKTPHYIVLGFFRDERDKSTFQMFMELQKSNQDMVFAYITNQELLPEAFNHVQEQPSLLLWHHPIYQGVLDTIVQQLNWETAQQLELSLKQARRTPLFVLDQLSFPIYQNFEQPVVGIISTHSSVSDLEENQEFYKLLLESLLEGGRHFYPQLNYAIINGLELQSIAKDLALDEEPHQHFHLIILEDKDTFYKYNGTIVNEDTFERKVKISEEVSVFLKQYQSDFLQQYLRSETQEAKVENNVLAVTGASFVWEVLEQSHLPVLLMIYSDSCGLCQRFLVYYEQLAAMDMKLKFTKINISRNGITKQFKRLVDSEQWPQLFIINKGIVQRYQRKLGSFEEMRAFVEQSERQE